MTLHLSGSSLVATLSWADTDLYNWRIVPPRKDTDLTYHYMSRNPAAAASRLLRSEKEAQREVRLYNSNLMTLHHPFYPPRECKKLLFVDLGANRGEVFKMFTQCLLSNTHTKETELHVHAFEPNAAFEEGFVWRFKKVRDILNHHHSDSSICVHEKAAWIHDDTIEFSVGLKSERTNSAISDIVDATAADQRKYAQARVVKCIDISTWLRTTINEAKGDAPFDATFVKMDIEGSEYPILDKMILDGTIALVDKLFVEFHPRSSDEPEEDTINEYIDKLCSAAPRLQIYKEVGNTATASQLHDRYIEVINLDILKHTI